jgi:hypothetical protein
VAILIFTTPGDYHSSAVEWALKSLGSPSTKVFLSDIPQLASLSWSPNGAEVLRFQSSSGVVAYDSFDTVWFRRMGGMVPGDHLHPSDATAVRRDWLAVLRWIQQYPRDRDVFCVNSPESTSCRNLKPYHLRLARLCGLDIPQTLLSNSDDDIRDFIRENRRSGAETIVKGFVPTAWKTQGGKEVSLGTALVTEEDLIGSDVASGPNIYQRRVAKSFEVRLTVMGSEMIAVRLDSQSAPDADLDFRRTPDWSLLAPALVAIPEAVRASLETFCERLGTPFGTFDFIVDPDGRWIFVEDNEAGNFLWVELYNPAIPMLDCFARFLQARDPKFRYRAPAGGELSLADFNAAEPALASVDAGQELGGHIKPKEQLLLSDLS